MFTLAYLNFNSNYVFVISEPKSKFRLESRQNLIQLKIILAWVIYLFYKLQCNIKIRLVKLD